MSEHQVIINLSADALRRALDRAEADGMSLSELVEALIRDGADSVRPAERGHPTNPGRGRLLPPPALESPTETRGRLAFLTNRLSPVKVAASVLDNLVKDGSWPALGVFQEAAANSARTLGLRLRKEDERAGRRGADRRWTGYPAGKDADAARDRYIASFTATTREGRLHGPLVVLGLAQSGEDGTIALTEAGAELAHASSPLDEGAERTLSEAETQIFKDRLLTAPDEAAGIGEFLGAIRHVAGVQTDLDALLATRNSDWSANRASAERAAMLGRLGELGMLRVEGRGSNARIELIDTTGFERGGAGEREAA
jgi:hypothetical protein